MKKGKKFGTVLNCMDGRVQVPVIEFIKKNYKVDYVDTITAPGINKILAEKNNKIIEHIKNCVEISVRIHNSKIIAIAGHYGCAGNPADKETQTKHTLEAIEVLKAGGIDVKIIGLWVDENFKVIGL